MIINIDWGKFNEEEGFDLEENKLIFDYIIDLTKYAHLKQNGIKYEIRSVINYPITSKDEDTKWKKYITFSKHLVNQKFYCYQPSGKVVEFTSKGNNNSFNSNENTFDSFEPAFSSINRKRFVPSVFFYEKMK